MSQANVELMVLSAEAFNRGDIDATLSRYHPEVEWRNLNHPPDRPECLKGTAAVRELWESWLDSFGGVVADIEEFVDAGNAVVCVTRRHARAGKGSGISVEGSFAEVYEFEDGFIVRATLGYPSRSEALKAIGLEG